MFDAACYVLLSGYDISCYNTMSKLYKLTTDNTFYPENGAFGFLCIKCNLTEKNKDEKKIKMETR